MKSIRLVLKSGGQLSLPLAHFDILQGVFYHLLSIEPDLADEIHNKQPGDHRPFKFFCFTDIKGKKEIVGDRLQYRGTCYWEIRSADDRVINAIKKAVAFSKVLPFNDGFFKIVSYSIEETKFIDNEVSFRLDTPATVYNTGDDGYVTYYSPDQSEFVEKLISNIHKKYHAFYGRECCENIDITVFSDEKDHCVTYYRDYVINSYYGRLRIKASAELLEFIYYTGLGAKNSMGFGTVSV